MSRTFHHRKHRVPGRRDDVARQQRAYRRAAAKRETREQAAAYMQERPR